MGRPRLASPLSPRRPATVLGWNMRVLREVNGWTIAQVAQGFGCSVSHISRVERGAKPSLELVAFYETAFSAEGLLLSLLEVTEHAPEQERRKIGGHRPVRHHAVPGDASTFVSDTIPNGTQLRPGQLFVKTWTIRNSGTVPWIGRQIERQGPLTGPGLISSIRHYAFEDTEPGDTVEIQAALKAPTYECSSIAYFKMVDAEGRLCFPERYQLGLDVVIRT